MDNNMLKKNNLAKLDVKKIAILIFVVYIVLAISFYFIAGYELHFRQSRGNIDIPIAEAATVEVTNGVVIEQTFIAKIQRLEAIAVEWGTSYRQNAGNVSMELYNLQNNALLMQKKIDASKVSECEIIEMSVDEPIENIHNVPLMLRIYGDSVAGSAISPLMYISNQPEDFSLTVNGEVIDGTLCFSATGEDYIWTGLHYWKFVTGFGLIIGVYLFATYTRFKKGKKSILVNAIVAIQKYQFLIKQLVSRDFKAKYKRSILGVFWSFLNPLLTMIVQYIVFSNMFKFDVPYYQVYLISGIIVFNYFSEACGMALTSIIGNASLITKVYVPKYIYPLTRILSSLVNLVISMIPLVIIALFSGLLPTKVYLLIPFVFVCLAIFCLGLGMLLSATMVFFRDIQFLWGVLTMIWMYLTPTFYPVEILPKEVAWVLDINPLYYYISFVRTCIIDGVSPEPIMYVQCFLFSIAFLAIGAFVFKKTQDKFVLYL